MDKPSLAIIGVGKLGSTLALALWQKGYRLSGLSDIDPARVEETARAVNPAVSDSDPSAATRGAEIVILAVPDDSVKAVSDQLASRQALTKGQILCHCSGFLPSSALVANKMLGASIASMHPLASFPRCLSPWDRFKGIYFGIEGDALALAGLRPLIESLDCSPVDILPSRKNLYHLSSVMASNYLVALMYAAGQMMETTVADKGKTEAMLQSLARTVIDSLGENGLENSLSGPIERGDVQTVTGHLEALKKDFPQGAELYKVLGRSLLRISKQRNPQGREWAGWEKLLD
ncbi:MAG: hypothetical protein A2509_07645 [Candidatus Edwardsbacteria bacterium RIFOXYD12_FULL_50_11]|uniref:DUF2520 domain-containing protein n=1 Tax=Candidatus Edwardsbacteria bacterium GWF2_54_11 TaxID=1817851 RepID=A0A1F5REE7_9BACT|nr:MAG: hypothetical protein A2502_12470 [Candidatus Edwardsbacteria bacterium RifOxyC12_full_54_24]OGF06545.1 MAG: hypothetical protein A2273_11685 [Candidatus Edwardsbacteria bacterium RifOxyA12_full_54_48]OGF12765.1 MAG: hypothetical protein A3K15_00070 [Candidatus Edwardsbacteria bacterium GWE2_54_12]OGF12826.1 MAG: hypothetical protein A2024_12180 [Candidatus Edwardsbacteria bacterium GWF2_54_11]OGF17863.1 MAG: hypothetical protein A2509_07645 [Candidatus Edwardsbacteria bacterium RIFOXYD1